MHSFSNVSKYVSYLLTILQFYFSVGRNIRILSSSSIGQDDPFMTLSGGSEAEGHEPFFIAYDREAKHFALLEKINLV